MVIDGGLATELEARGHDLSDRLWSARLLLTEPEAIEAVHLAYFRAGAQVATTASYQATIKGSPRPGSSARGARGDRTERGARGTASARRYRDEAGDRRDLLVAGSVGPYGAMLADGSEYRGDYDPGTAALRDFHAPAIEALARGRRRPPRLRDDPDHPRGGGPARSARRRRHAGLAVVPVPGWSIDGGR